MHNARQFFQNIKYNFTPGLPNNILNSTLDSKFQNSLKQIYVGISPGYPTSILCLIRSTWKCLNSVLDLNKTLINLFDDINLFRLSRSWCLLVPMVSCFIWEYVTYTWGEVCVCEFDNIRKYQWIYIETFEQYGIDMILEC